MKLKATLPLLLLLLIFGQLSTDLCQAQCMSIAKSDPACAMHAAAHATGHGLCAACKHGATNGRSLSAMASCSGQACAGVLALTPDRSDRDIKPQAWAIAFDVHAPPFLQAAHPPRVRDTRNRRYIPPFDPLTTSLRI